MLTVAQKKWRLLICTLAMTMRSARLLEMALAMSMGDVSHAMPSRMEPSGIVIEIGTRGCAIRKYQVL